MKKLHSYSLTVLALAMLVFFSACKKNNLVIDQDVKAPVLAKFNTASAVDSVTTYYIRATGNVVKLPVGLTSAPESQRSVKFSYSSRTAIKGTDFNAPDSLIIPAGGLIDTLVFSGVFANFPATRIDTVTITIDPTSDVKGASYQSRYKIIMRKYCDVVLANLSGDYSNTREYSSPYTAQAYGPYLTSVTGLVATGPTSARCKLVNLYDFGWDDIDATLDWANPSAFKVTINQQATGTTETVGGVDYPAFVKTSATVPSTFSACDRSITLHIDYIANGQVLASAYRIWMR